MNLFNYSRRHTLPVTVADTVIGGNHPVVIQTMTNSATTDIKATVAQCERVIAAGAELIRLTTQGIREVNSLREIAKLLSEKGYKIPLSADIQFSLRVAFAAALVADKVRINPGNLIDKQKRSAMTLYSDDEYQLELEKVAEKLTPFLEVCKEHGRAIRIGVNHGSLSDRIMSRYGDTIEGMVESSMEYLRIAVERDFTDIVVSLKSSNSLLMTKAVRLLVKAMDDEGMQFPLHLGVTEAGGGDDGRIKSAVGIGALLSDGIGDTIRVSLSEEPEAELPVARKLVEYVLQREGHDPIAGEQHPHYSPFSMDRRLTERVSDIGGDSLPIVISDRSVIGNSSLNPDFLPDYIYVGGRCPDDFPVGMKLIVDYKNWDGRVGSYPLFSINQTEEIKNSLSKIKFVMLSYPELSDEHIEFLKQTPGVVVILTTDHLNGVGEQRAFIHALLNADCPVPLILQRNYSEERIEDIQIRGGVDFGTLLLDGFGNGIMITNSGDIDIADIDATAFGILQAAGLRRTKAEFIACPGCGRTLFDLQSTLTMIEKNFSHLKHLKIAVMGCIVNGVGEMADADYGYVGAEPGRISLYRKRQLIKKSVPQEEAVEHLTQLIKKYGDWIGP